MTSQKSIWNLEYSANPNKWHKETLNFPKLKNNSTVLELGAGNGKTTKAILKQNIKSLTGVDFSSKSINILKQNYKDKRAKYINSNITKLPFKENSFNTIICYYILNNLLEKDRNKAVKEIFRILKSKGTIYFRDFAKGDYRHKKQSNISVEKNTIKNGKGILCHFFTIPELIKQFNDSSKSNFKELTSNPLRNKPNIIRKIISGKIIK